MDSREAKYMKISDELRTEIVLGKLKEGAFLPTEMELMRLFDAGRSTVRHALAILKEEGLIEIRKGSGSVVLSRPEGILIPRPGRGMNSFSVEYHTENYSGSAVTSAAIEEVDADEKTAERLGLKPGSGVYRIQRIWSIEGVPYNYMVQFLPADLFPMLREKMKNSGRIADIMRESYGLVPERAEEHISAKNADFIEANLLNVEIGTALLYTYRLGFCKKGIYEFAEFYGNPAYTGYVAQLEEL